MNLAVFGAAGKTGQLLATLALSKGHSITALVRSPGKFVVQSHRLRVVQGDIGEAEKVSQTVAGADAVISVLGPTSNRAELAVSRGMDNILAAMRQHGVRRLVVSIGAGVRDPHDKPTVVHALFGILVRLLSRNVYADMLRVDQAVRKSEVDWTLIRVPRLVDGLKTGRIRVGYLGADIGWQLSRADLAEFMLSQVADETYICQAPAVSG